MLFKNFVKSAIESSSESLSKNTTVNVNRTVMCVLRKRSTHAQCLLGSECAMRPFFRRRRQHRSHFMTAFAYGNPVKIYENLLQQFPLFHIFSLKLSKLLTICKIYMFASVINMITRYVR